MPKQTKDQKRKAKLEKRRKAGERQLQQQTEMLIRMLTELCAPLLPEYTDDSKGPDLAGRAILYRLGQIAWDMEISQDLSFNDYAGKLGSLDDASREMIQKTLPGCGNGNASSFRKRHWEFKTFPSASVMEFRC
ncbi:MAG: hypothetical protein L6W00_20295 [Lentisphaeria bacterium]|nr:MAG: hypothetical protein L6W00_20295 [Lentisphaeria bacterium]